MNRDFLYNQALSPEEAVLVMLDLPLDEGFDSGDLFKITIEGALKDADTGIDVPVGYYSVTDVSDSLVHLVQYIPETKTYGGKEYSVTPRELEELVMSGGVCFRELFDEGRYRGSVTDPREIRAMFVKGYLRKKNKPGGGTDLQYARRSFSKFQSGNTNPEYALNRRRQKRRAERARRKGIATGTHVVRRRAKSK